MDHVPLDTTDIERWTGQPVGGLQLLEPVTATDVRRWVQAMQNPNPLHYDAHAVGVTASGELLAPQSFVIATAINHGVKPALQGRLEGSHHMNAGDEWWFSARVAVGDRVTSVRSAFDFRVTDTAFAGPTVFQRGDTTYVNQRGEVLARQRSTVMRYLVENLAKQPADDGGDDRAAPTWTEEQTAAIEDERLAYARRVHEGQPARFADISEGDELPRRPIGPHSIQSFTTEQRAYLYTVWGNLCDDHEGRSTSNAFGSVAPMAFRAAEARHDPGFGDLLYFGGGRGHTDSRYANLIGMPRPFGYGASMSAYMLDFVENWAGPRAAIVYSNLQYRKPVLVGDMTHVAAVVAGLEPDEVPGQGLVHLAVEMTNQQGKVLGRGPITVFLRPGE